FLYSLAGSPSLIGGVVQGNGSSSGNTVSSANAREFSIEFGDVVDVGLTASFVPRQSLNGSVSAFGQSVSFTASYDASYDTTATAAAVAGSYIGQVASSAGVESASVTITLAGAVTAQGISGCRATGTITPRPRGNAYDVSLQFGA